MVLFGALWFIILSIPGMMYRHELGSHAYDYLNHRSYLPLVGVLLLLAEAVPAAWYSGARSAFIPLPRPWRSSPVSLPGGRSASLPIRRHFTTRRSDQSGVGARS